MPQEAFKGPRGSSVRQKASRKGVSDLGHAHYKDVKRNKKGGWDLVKPKGSRNSLSLPREEQD